MIFRIKIMNSELPIFTKFDNPASASNLSTRIMTYSFLPAFNFWLLLNPSRLCADWTMGSIELITSITDVRNIFTIFFYLFLILLVIKVYFIKQKTIFIIAISLLVFPFLPASNIFFPVGFVVAERVLYAPSMGFSILIAYAILKLFVKYKLFEYI
jgi:hypothetical protein